MLPMQSSFILQKTSISLPELQWGFGRGIIGAKAVVDIASWMLAKGNTDEQIVKLAELTHVTLPEAKKILGGNFVGGVDIDAIKAKWLWLLLSWVYDQHREEEGVFDMIDAIYADFDYPGEMAPFGPHAPVYQAKSDPRITRDEVVREWRRFLERGQTRFR